MKHIRSALAASLLLLGTAAVASAQQQAPAQHQARAQGQHAGKRGPGRRGAGDQLFKGIKLTDAEKANIKNVHAKYAPQMKALREQFKGQGQQGKIARGDTAAMRQRWEQNAPQREQMKRIMDAERADLRNALAPADQAKFDANVQAAQQRLANRAAKGKGRRAAGDR